MSEGLSSLFTSVYFAVSAFASLIFNKVFLVFYIIVYSFICVLQSLASGIGKRIPLTHHVLHTLYAVVLYIVVVYGIVHPILKYRKVPNIILRCVSEGKTSSTTTSGEVFHPIQCTSIATSQV